MLTLLSRKASLAWLSSLTVLALVTPTLGKSAEVTPRDFKALDLLEQRFLQDQKNYEAAADDSDEKAEADTYRQIDKKDAASEASSVFVTQANGEITNESLSRAQQYLASYGTYEATSVPADFYLTLATAAFNGISKDLESIATNKAPKFSDMETWVLQMIQGWKNNTDPAANLYAGVVPGAKQQALNILKTQLAGMPEEEIKVLATYLDNQATDAEDKDIAGFYESAANLAHSAAEPPVVESGMIVQSSFPDGTGFTMSNSSYVRPVTLVTGQPMTLTGQTTDQYGKALGALTSIKATIIDDDQSVSVELKDEGALVFNGLKSASNVRIDIVGEGASGTYTARFVVRVYDPARPTTLRVRGRNREAGIFIDAISTRNRVDSQVIRLPVGEKIRLNAEVRDQYNGLIIDTAPNLSLNSGYGIWIDSDGDGSFRATEPNEDRPAVLEARVAGLATRLYVYVIPRKEPPRAYLSANDGRSDIFVEVGERFDIRWSQTGEAFHAELTKRVEGFDFACGLNEVVGRSFGFYENSIYRFSGSASDRIDYCGAGRTFIYEYRAYGPGGKSDWERVRVHVKNPERPSLRLSVNDRGSTTVDPGSRVTIRWHAEHAYETWMTRTALTRNDCGDPVGWERPFTPSHYDNRSRHHGESEYLTGPCESGATYRITYHAKGFGGEVSTDATIVVNQQALPLKLVSQYLPGGQVRSRYSATLQARGGTQPYRWSVIGGELPPGIQITDRGNIEGTPRNSGNYSVTVQVRDRSGQSLSAVLTIAVADFFPPPPPPAPLQLVTALLRNGTSGVPYEAKLEASGGKGPYSWQAFRMPGWLRLSPSGQLSAVSPNEGSYTFNVTVTDSQSPSKRESRQLNLQIDPPPFKALAIRQSPSATAEAGVRYSGVAIAVGGKQPYHWSLSGMPSGMSIDKDSGVISGLLDRPGNYRGTVSVTDSQGTPATASAAFNLTVTSPAFAPLLITPPTLAEAKQGVAYSVALQATGGKPPYEWSATGLPSGMTIQSRTGLISGAPNLSGPHRVSVKVSDSQSPAKANAITVNLMVSAPVLAPIKIVATTLPNAQQGSPYSAGVKAEGGKAPYGWSASGLPAGLSLNARTGVISGSPTTSGTFQINVTVTDSQNPSKQLTGSLTLMVSAPSVPPLAIALTTLPNGQQGAAYSAVVRASGGKEPYAWSATGLPVGLSMNTRNGMISGTPMVPGNFSVRVTVTDSQSPSKSLPASLSLAIAAPAAPALVILEAPLAPAQQNARYSATVQASGGKAPYQWSARGLPDGMTMDAQSGVISGTTKAAGSFRISVRVSDSQSPAKTANATLNLLVNAPELPELKLRSGALVSAQQGSAYSATLKVVGGQAPYSWSASDLPRGLSLDNRSGVISGTPRDAGRFEIKVTVSDSQSPAKSAMATYSLSVAASAPTIPPLTIEDGGLPSGQLNSRYSATLKAAGGQPPYSWSASELPDGLAIDTKTGAISGRPIKAGTFRFSVKVTDSQSPAKSASGNYSLSVAAPELPPLKVEVNLPSGQQGSSYSGSILASGGKEPYSYRASGLPSGLSVDGRNGAISGTPKEAGRFEVKITVTDSQDRPQSRSASHTISIKGNIAPLSIGRVNLPNLKAKVAYPSVHLEATGGTPPYSWSVSKGSLPAGMSMSSKGEISGTPTTAGVSNFTVTVSDQESPAASANRSLSITVQ